mgnify:FL=1
MSRAQLIGSVRCGSSVLTRKALAQLIALITALGCAPLPALITDAQVRAVLAPEQAEADRKSVV